MKTEEMVRSWRAIEALRAGVPSRDAVQALGSAQPAIEERFKAQLAAAREGFAQEVSSEGMLIAGDFGTGKSHLLEYLQLLALEKNFVCSKVVISKETPLYDPAKVHNAAVESAKVPDRVGAALVAVSTKLDFDRPEYAQFFEWVNRPDNGLSTHFAATLHVFEQDKYVWNSGRADSIIRFWAGGRISVPELRSWLKDLGEAATYRIERVKEKELALQRYRFIPRLMVAAGYAGWVILVDEVELIGRYSTIGQRARSYAAIARLMGKLEGGTIPGLTTVLSISKAFEAEVLDERNDEELISRRLRGGGSSDDVLLASQAERGIRIIQRDRVALQEPTEGVIRGVCTKIRDIYGRAYQWDPPTDCDVNRTLRIRQHVKRLINDWDLRRLYAQYEPEIDVTELREDYREDRELETPPEEEPSEL